jgi:hypothetical protein
MKTAREGNLKNVHYSRCQLFIGDFEFPPKGKATEPRTLPYVRLLFFCLIPVPQPLFSVFATRMGTSAPYWQPMGARYEWDRFAAATTPRLPSATSTSDRIRIPWPKRPDRPKYERMSCISLVRLQDTENGL